MTAVVLRAMSGDVCVHVRGYMCEGGGEGSHILFFEHYRSVLSRTAHSFTTDQSNLKPCT